MKKLIASVLAALMIAAMLTGCSEGNSTVKDDKFKGEMMVISREDGSGTRGAFIELMGIENKDENGNKVDRTTQEATVTNSTSVMMTTVAGNKHAMGYISLGSLNDTVHALEIDGAKASVENISNGTYTVSRPFNIVTKSDVSESTQDFISFIMSADGQKVIEENGYIKASNEKAYEGAYKDEKIVVAGSSSVAPVMEKLKEAYQVIYPNAQIEIQQNDSSTGIAYAADGSCDIGMASRDLKDSENGLIPTVIAMDGIAVIVNNDNPIKSLTKEQICSIYIGETTDWSQVQ